MDVHQGGSQVLYFKHDCYCRPAEHEGIECVCSEYLLVARQALNRVARKVYFLRAFYPWRGLNTRLAPPLLLPYSVS